MKNVFYINLEHRKDRKQQIESELNALGWDYERFNAIKMPNGRAGCSMSHLKVLQTAKERNLDYVVVVEDDAMFVNKDFINQQLQTVFNNNIDFDVFLLAGNIRPPIQKITDYIFRVFTSYTTTGYIVKKQYYDTLINNIKQGIPLLLKNPNYHMVFAIDTFWMQLQRKDKWYMIFPRTVTQRPDFSDIEQRELNYNHLMLDNININK